MSTKLIEISRLLRRKQKKLPPLLLPPKMIPTLMLKKKRLLMPPLLVNKKLLPMLPLLKSKLMLKVFQQKHEPLLCLVITNI